MVGSLQCSTSTFYFDTDSSSAQNHIVAKTPLSSPFSPNLGEIIPPSRPIVKSLNLSILVCHCEQWFNFELSFIFYYENLANKHALIFFMNQLRHVGHNVLFYFIWLARVLTLDLTKGLVQQILGMILLSIGMKIIHLGSDAFIRIECFSCE